MCAECGAGFRRIELATHPGATGEYRCPACDTVLEKFDGGKPHSSARGQGCARMGSLSWAVSSVNTQSFAFVSTANPSGISGTLSASVRLQMGQGAPSAPHGWGDQRSFGFVLIGGMQLPKRVSKGSKREPNLAMIYSNAKATEPSNTSAHAGGWIAASTAPTTPMTIAPRTIFQQRS
jgi:hypothetical protein